MVDKAFVQFFLNFDYENGLPENDCYIFSSFSKLKFVRFKLWLDKFLTFIFWHIKSTHIQFSYVELYTDQNFC